MNLRRSATALGGAAVLCLAGLTAASGALADGGEPPAALFGDGDPEYDGVWRQSVALLAQHTAGVVPADEAVTWLAGQSCEHGGFAAYRAGTGADAPCGEEVLADTNATAVAVQALTALGGHDQAVQTSVDWLKSQQNDDGGWPYLPGDTSDTNSTALVAGALAAVGEDPADTEQGGASPYDALTSLQLGCEAEEQERGAYAWQPEGDGELFANDTASVDAVLASYGSGLVVDPDRAGDEPVPAPLNCAESDGEEPTGAQSAEAGAAYLTGALERNGGHLTSALAGADDQPDYSGTAKAVLALAAGGHREAAAGPLQWLADHHTEWDGHQDSPAGVGLLVLAAHAGGEDPSDFGGSDLVSTLNALGPAPQTIGDSGEGEASDEAGDPADSESSEDSGSTGWLLWVLVVGVLAGVGAGLLVSMVKRRKTS
ncbi:prenyltransferase/squalene oxidase repeat-containing protein [Streptomyces sp. ACA25]|uniref:prenyltransferase/squalene oxidase repeat-containing protein n=1 Tax=Streptomyces sp. ACA25 TaxID=3022596 RepID=UPI00230709F4|nr:prenyltransferase/squalene oxidase repeat-containing protein [Streptomyces sp. ACA25]MDB1087784.1 prenyltransferase/squalene oxidase repeat-containing protein [Streptomyces sp. ACA25]